MPKIKLNLNMDSVDKAIKELESYQKKVEELGKNTVKTMSKKGEELAVSNALYMNAYDTGWLVNSIKSEIRDDKGYVIADAPHAAYVEFGTGLRGSREQHPEAFVHGWKYDVNEHGESGWYYMGYDGKVHWTKGMPSRPFMYDTAKELRKEEVEIVKSLLKGGE